MPKFPEDLMEMSREELIEYAIDLLNVNTDTERTRARKSIISFHTLYNIREIMLDETLTYDQLGDLRAYLFHAADKIWKLHPYIQVELLPGEASFDELFFPNGKIWDTNLGPHPLQDLIEEELIKPLLALNEKCERLIRTLPKRAREPEQIRKQVLVNHILLMFAEYRPEEARPYSGEFPTFLQTVYWYVTGDKEDQLRKQHDTAFQKLRNMAPELLPEHLRTKRSRARPDRSRPKKS